MKLYIRITGVVQGVGFRPFAKRLALSLGLSGTVRNTGGIVIINITGYNKALDEYVRRLTINAPSCAVINDIYVKEIVTAENDTKKTQKPAIFNIEYSDNDKDGMPVVISPDIATCDRCKKQMYDSKNRRFLHPFISCTDCGPRYSIIEDIPYDRETTSMTDFTMCTECSAEYTNIDNERCHAQTIACKSCGPTLKLCVYNAETGKYSDMCESSVDSLKEASDMLAGGNILAVKDIGGYHFVCRADNKEAILKLRQLKKRQSKSFAIMFSDVSEVRKYAYVSDKEEKLLSSKARPIVLVKKKRCKNVLDMACGDSRYVGAMLACNPVQIYLADKCSPLIMTSGNLGGEPIITSDERMRTLVTAKGVIDGILSNDRRIVTPLDDSIVKVTDGKVQMLRRARGYVPLPVTMSSGTDKTILASGGDLKASFCFLDKTGQAVCSQYFGDLDDYDACGVWKTNIKRMERLYGFKPDILACDMHPRYYSSQISRTLYDYERVYQVQHHHAHIASVVAEHGIKGDVLGFAFDGTGYGTDKTIWGSEAMLLSGASFERLTHLAAIPMCGGDEIARDADMALMCYLINAGIEPKDFFDKTEENERKLALVKSVIEYKTGISYSSSMGRLFDAVSALVGIRHYNSYEGECAMALEAAAEEAADVSEDNDIQLKLACRDGVWDTDGLIRQIAEYIKCGICETEYGRARVAYGFHNALSEAVICYAVNYCKNAGKKLPIALSGGVFANSVLTKMITDGLKKENFMVYLNESVPAGDGGIALGQAYIASQIMKNEVIL